ncbi:hypothetical protein XI09_33280 [Bradyrhizobium sp. CCBAU 11386]|uniref:hypothetical protein n=1 Tax=Bradyrhizobium sp. CCBAU 11386 TaxID=1630837 RepID=UPI0023046B30|nr:hypothetical protein [Bradyrhizobium sp. CCBAU 11386]MDA9509426.1 hypothetical protein [Bradyrhizobium sp. CCBAU 11386]
MKYLNYSPLRPCYRDPAEGLEPFIPTAVAERHEFMRRMAETLRLNGGSPPAPGSDHWNSFVAGVEAAFTAIYFDTHARMFSRAVNGSIQ